MYVFDPNTCYTMPTCGKFRDPKPWESGGMRYGKMTVTSVVFLTEREALQRCLPEPFRSGEEPLVSIYAARCEDVDWLAGRSYNLVGFDVSAIFDGRVDIDVRGNYCVAMWEDMCEPIIGGRDHSGIPKIFAEINYDKQADDSWRCRVSRFDHLFLDFAVTDLEPMDRKQCDELERAKHDATWMGYKYIPRLENDGPDVSYATVYPSSGQCDAAWRGKGSFKANTATFQQTPTQHEFINLLATMPVKEIRSAMLVNWKECRAIDRLPRRLT